MSLTALRHVVYAEILSFFSEIDDSSSKDDTEEDEKDNEEKPDKKNIKQKTRNRPSLSLK